MGFIAVDMKNPLIYSTGQLMKEATMETEEDVFGPVPGQRCGEY